MDEQILRKLLANARNCPVCTQVMLESFQVPGCQILHMACKECCDKARYCTQCNANVNFAQNMIPNLMGMQLNPTPQPPEVKKSPCCYSVNGCDFRCLDQFLNSHQMECRFRKYDCLGKTTDIFKCPWQGLQEGLLQHMETAHPQNWGNLGYKAVSFISVNQPKDLQVFKAHGRTFACSYKKDNVQHKSYWIIAMIASKKQSSKFFYDFEIFKPDDDVRKIRFSDVCESDSTPISDIISTENCVVISENLLKTYLHKGKINYRFWIKNSEASKGDNKSENKGKNQDDKQTEDKNEKKDKGAGKKPPKQQHNKKVAN